MRVIADRDENELRMVALRERKEESVEDMLIARVADARRVAGPNPAN